MNPYQPKSSFSGTSMTYASPVIIISRKMMPDAMATSSSVGGQRRRRGVSALVAELVGDSTLLPRPRCHQLAGAGDHQQDDVEQQPEEQHHRERHAIGEIGHARE